MIRRRAWFAPKAVGFGSSLPISWEGWVAFAVFLGLIVIDARYASSVWRAFGIAGLTAAFSLVCYFKTEGGWRWRP